MKRKRIPESSASVQPDAAGTESSEEYDVFLSFRGSDTRYGFIDCLYEFLTEAGIRVFMDDEALRVGDDIGNELLMAIDSSRLYIPVFSRNYASSKWCLIELSRMVKCARKSDGKEILPVFFDVEPEDVKMKTELYTKDLLRHEESFGQDMVRKWRKALRKVPTLKGWNLKSNQGYGKLIRHIAEDISRRLELRNRTLPNHLVGMNHQVQAVLELLDYGSSDVRIIVIHGMGGIGKTTLAKAVFNKVCGQFQGCSFLPDVRESSEGNGIVKLQKKLLQDIQKFSSHKFYDASDGMIRISRVLPKKNVLIILDDVNDMEQIMKLIGMGEWIGPGSRVIITTRNLSCVDNIEKKSSVAHLQSKMVYPYEMGELRFNDSLRLLSWHAFHQDAPPPSYGQLPRDILSFTRGVPLAIEVIGSYLRWKSMAIWREMVKKLKKGPPEQIFQHILMLIYKKLCDEEKEVFLDVAFFFAGHEKTNAFHYWNACELYPEMSTYALVSYALVKIDSSNRFWMHDLLKDLGREVVRQQGIENLGRRSRLCNEDAKHMLINAEGTRDVKALKLDSSHAHNFTPVELSVLSDLRFLELSGGSFVGNFDCRLSKLRWLSWHNCPSDFQGENICLKNLVVLRISGNTVTNSWGGWEKIMTAKNLKVLVLEGLNLTTTPKFSSFSRLKRLVIHDCRSLVHLDPSVSNLGRLKSLEVIRDDCPRLPEDISSDESCSEVLQLPSSVCNLKAISRLEIVGVELKQLPGDIGQLKGLKILMLKHCGTLQLPESIGELISLRELWLNGSGITELPDSVGGLVNLKLLDVSQNRLTGLPSTIETLQNLESLNASENEHMKRKIPSAIGNLPSLSSLNLSQTGIRRLPASIRQLSRLQDLSLNDCNHIQELPKLPPSLKDLNFSSRMLKVVPDLSNLTNLVRLSLSNCVDSEGDHLDHPEVLSGSMTWILHLQKLEFLRVIMSPTLHFPTKLDSLSRLRELIVSCPDLSQTTLPSHLDLLGLFDSPSPSQPEHHSTQEILSEPSTSRSSLTEIRFDGLQSLDNLSALVVSGCQSLERVHDVSRLKNLRNLYFNGCPNLVEIQGLAQLESLEELEIVQCDSIQRLPDRSQIKSPGNITLYIHECHKLQDFYGPYELYEEASKGAGIPLDES